jgi:hypothetical protein
LGFGFGFGFGGGSGGVGTFGPGGRTSGLTLALTTTVSVLTPQAVGPTPLFIASPEYVTTQR